MRSDRRLNAWDNTLKPRTYIDQVTAFIGEKSHNDAESNEAAWAHDDDKGKGWRPTPWTEPFALLPLANY